MHVILYSQIDISVFSTEKIGWPICSLQMNRLVLTLRFDWNFNPLTLVTPEQNPD